MASFLNRLPIFLICVVSCYTTDPHESISRRTPSAIPFYLNHHSYYGNIYTSSGLLLLEYYATSPINGTLKWSQLNMKAKMDTSYSVSEDCQLGEIFNQFYVSLEERLTLINRLDSTCFRGKWDLVTPDTDITGDELLWTQILNDCKSKRVPESLIAPEQLLDLLTDFQAKFIQPESGLQLSLSLKDLSIYYQVPLASCAFSNENSFLVAFQVPLKSINEDNDGPSDFQVYSLIPIPLWMPDEHAMVCRLEDRLAGSTFDLEAVYHYNLKTGEVIPERNLLCHVRQEPLCFFPTTKNLLHRSMKKTCAQAIIESLDEDILCDLKCELAASYSFPIIRQVQSDRYLIVADLSFNEDIRVECPLFQKEETLIFPATGALEVVLPCDCQIRYRKYVFNSTMPCGAEFSKIPINFPGNYDSRDVSIEQLSK